MLSTFAKNPKRLHRIQFLGKIFSQAGHELRIAGGAVRDILRGVEPTDIDFATTSPPEQSLKILQPHEGLMRIITTQTGLSHGTVAVKFKGLDDQALNQLNIDQNNPSKVSPRVIEPVYDDESPFEITTLRSDKITDGRHAKVEFISDWKLDAERRDLTINAMFLTVEDGQLIDYFGGESDLKNGIVRFVGNAEDRIKEDYLRILRYFRFWSRYGQSKRPDEATLQTIRNNLDGLQRISGERIWVEIKKIFNHIPAHETIKLMLELDVFSQIDMSDKDEPIRIDRLNDDVVKVQDFVSKYSLEVLQPQLATRPMDAYLKRMKEILPVILLSTIFESRQICTQAHKRLKFSNLERDTLIYIVDNTNNNKGCLTLHDLKSELVKAPRSEIIQTRNKMSAYLIYRGELGLLDQINNWEIPRFPIDGLEVTSELGKRMIDRKRTKNILQDLRDEWAKSEFKLTREELWDIMQNDICRYQDNDTNKI